MALQSSATVTATPGSMGERQVKLMGEEDEEEREDTGTPKCL